MNTYIEAQITNMTTMVKTFKQTCYMAALKNDGMIDKAEQKQLDKINKAADEFIKRLSQIK